VKIWVTGASGSLGEELVARLVKIFPESDLLIPNRNSLDLLNHRAVENFVKVNKPSHVYHLAALVYGISGSLEFPEKSLLSNTALDHSVFSALFKFPPKWIYYASTVATYGYPFVSLPLREQDWLIGLPHASEYGYAMAKRHAKSYLDILHKDFGVDFVYGLTTNLFGPSDRFQSGRGHVVISLLRKGLLARQNGTNLDVWGNKTTSRDFLSTKDAASLLVELMNKHTDIINIASGQEILISSLAEEITLNLQIKHGYRFTGENEGIPKRICSIEKLSAHSQVVKDVDSKSQLESLIANFVNNNQ
jgi:GDP-L-fucose synthase